MLIVVERGSEQKARNALRELRQLVRSLEKRYSEWLPGSEISRLNRDAGRGWVLLAPEMAKLIRGALHVSRVTHGAFDISWAPLGPLWKEAERRQREPSADELKRVLARVGWQKIELREGRLRFSRPGMRLGIAGVAKGWIVDALFRHLQLRGFRDVVVNIGGDLRTSGRSVDGSKRRFVIADPFHKGRYVASLTIAEISIATSGNYLRYRRIGRTRVGHIVDPRSGRPPSFDGSVTVLTRDAAMADALATALFVMGPEKGLALARGIRGLDVIYVTRAGIRTSLGPGLLH